MTHRYCFECVDRTSKDILSEQCDINALLPFGGLPFVLGGDFRQVLPVIRGACRSEVVNAALYSSPLWNNVRLLFDN